MYEGAAGLSGCTKGLTEMMLDEGWCVIRKSSRTIVLRLLASGKAPRRIDDAVTPFAQDAILPIVDAPEQTFQPRSLIMARQHQTRNKTPS